MGLPPRKTRPDRADRPLASFLRLGLALLHDAHPARQGSNRRALFWTETPGYRPQDHVRPGVPWGRRTAVADLLRTPSRTLGYMGWAECRICGVRLGVHDFFGYGFVWPEKAEHYVLHHDVWTTDLDDLLDASGRAP